MNIQDFSKTEHQLTVDASQEYGELFAHAQFASDFVDSFVKSAGMDATFFVAFYTQVKKHLILAFLSAIRLYHVQANFNFRYTTEAGAWAAFAMAHSDLKRDLEKYAKSQDDGTLTPTQDHRAKMYRWLESNYQLGNDSIEKFKGALQFSAHANIVDAHRNFQGMRDYAFHTSPFDLPEDHLVQTDLWTIGNLTMGLLDFFYGVNQNHHTIEFADDFLYRIDVLKREDMRLKNEMKKHPRFQKFQKI